jgi:hypothetical protein
MRRLARHGERTGEKKNPYRTLVGKPEGEKPLGKHSRRWEDNILTDFGKQSVKI